MWKITVPKTENTVREATLVRWHKNEGEKVEKGEIIAEMETFKAIVEITSPGEGTLYKKFIEEGEEVPISTVIAVIAEKGEKISSESIKIFSRIKIAPIARKLAQDKGIDLSLIKGSGPLGAITKEDIEGYLQKGKKDLSIKETRELIGIQKITAQRMTFSYQNIPQFSLCRKVDISRILKIKNNINCEGNFHLSLVDFMLKALVYAFEKFPEFNAVFEDNTHKLIEEINIGLAVSTERGLIVPVIRNLKGKKIDEIAQIRKNITEQALRGKLQPEDLEKGTFTVTNLGLQGIEYFNPLINPPQVAILGMGKSENMSLPLSLTMDHRILDGVKGAEFLQFLSEKLASY